MLNVVLDGHAGALPNVFPFRSGKGRKGVLLRSEERGEERGMERAIETLKFKSSGRVARWPELRWSRLREMRCIACVASFIHQSATDPSAIDWCAKDAYTAQNTEQGACKETAH